MREPSASQLDLAAACGHPFTSGVEWPAEDRSPAAALGTRIHRGCEAITTREHVYPAIFAGLTETERRTLAGCVDQAREYLGKLPRAQIVEAEAWLQYHPATGRARRSARGVRRDEAGWWSAVLDHVSIYPDGSIRVIDWKTGQQEYTAEVSRNRQLRCQAVAAATYFGASRVCVELVYLDRHRAEVDAAEFDALDLCDIAAELRALRRSLTGGPTPPMPGTHCTRRWCPLLGVCSATQSALATIQPTEDRFAPVPRNEAHARWMLERLPAVRAGLDAIETGIREFARRTPIDLGEGRVYAWHEKSRRTVRADTPEQQAAIVSVLGVHARGVVRVKHQVSIEDLEDAVRAKLLAEHNGKPPRGAIGRLMAEVFAGLEKVGGFAVGTYEIAEAFKLRREQE